ncbi:MAG: hypothetical protein LC789_17645 [Actinobacteria bacterium]|nr:hypothetical protein [Actinomycetota bacterium]MCA1721529.1 hypothetical protein [Actinomycetota bacterium]
MRSSRAAGSGPRGIYLPHARPPSDAELVAVAMAHCPTGVVTGELVLRQLGLRWLPETGGVHVLARSGGSSGLVRVTRTEALPPTWTRYGGRLADVGRAIVDTARSLDRLTDVRGVVLGAVADGWATPDGLAAVLDAGQRNGSGLTRRAVVDAERGCASPPEAELMDALAGRGVPFYVNPDVLVDGVLVGRPDVWLLGRGVGGEVESRAHHEQDDGQVESTYDRHERFRSCGLDLVHLSVRRIRLAPVVAADQLLSRRPVREPNRLVVRPRGPLLC